MAQHLKLTKQKQNRLFGAIVGENWRLKWHGNFHFARNVVH